MVTKMAAEKQFKFGITSEFKPLWEEFENLAPGSKKSKMIRYLIYNFLYKNGNRTRNKFENANSEDWEYVEGALKVYNKFNKKRTKVMKEHVINKKKFWIEKYDYAIRKKIISGKELKKLKDEGFVIMKNIASYNLLPDIDQANGRIILKRMNGNKHEQIERYLSKPDEYYVKCKWRNNSYSYYEEAYEEFKTLRKIRGRRSPSISELIKINRKLMKKLRNNNLVDLHYAKATRDFMQLAGSGVKQLNLRFEEIPWNDTPEEINNCLPLNKFHIDTKKNLQKLRSDEKVIYNCYTILKFKIDEAPKIIGPRKVTTEEAKEWRFYDE